MTEETLFAAETKATPEDIASCLDGIAEGLAYGSEITLISETDSITIGPPPEVDFDVSVERERSRDSPSKLEFELELEWDEDTGTLRLKDE